MMPPPQQKHEKTSTKTQTFRTRKAVFTEQCPSLPATELIWDYFDSGCGDPLMNHVIPHEESAAHGTSSGLRNPPVSAAAAGRCVKPPVWVGAATTSFSTLRKSQLSCTSVPPGSFCCNELSTSASSQRRTVTSSHPDHLPLQTGCNLHTAALVICTNYDVGWVQIFAIGVWRTSKASAREKRFWICERFSFFH